jgi:hypothetical protein
VDKSTKVRVDNVFGDPRTFDIFEVILDLRVKEEIVLEILLQHCRISNTISLYLQGFGRRKDTCFL